MPKTLISVYYSCYDTPLPADTFNRLMAALPEGMRASIHRFKRWEDAHAGLLGKHLLQYALPGYSLADIAYTVHRRPFIKGAPDFNISHAGNMVVCAVAGKGDVGIDIEKPTLLSVEDFHQQFTPEEWDAIRIDPASPEIFYRYWTRKEAVLKAAGTGLNEALHLLNVMNNSVFYHQHTWQLSAVPIMPGYVCHVASGETEIAINTHAVSMQELVSMYR
ncbi:4'-phosphopantetheinyl transferase [Chitinophaga sp. W2I13]|uniref:4'-phosphopantetheinyl transferase family protein n=1 Tax=Chitinophaga sp. W2I13 TaxID=3373923 RepID=UPI003D1DBE4D